MADFTTYIPAWVKADSLEEAMDKFASLVGDHGGVYLSGWDGGGSDVEEVGAPLDLSTTPRA